MYGKSQKNNVKQAVSNRMRNIYADQTLRVWVHPEHGETEPIRTIDLRDRYLHDNVRISNLKRVTDGKHKQHKGWALKCFTK